MNTNDTAQFAQAAGWPAIAGPPNAVNWALAIRRETIERFDDYFGEELARLGEPAASQVATARNLVRAWMLTATDAAFWITNRGASIHDWFRLAAHLDPSTRAYVVARAEESAPSGS